MMRGKRLYIVTIIFIDKKLQSYFLLCNFHLHKIMDGVWCNVFIVNYLPMQKRPNIELSTSLLLISPVMLPK